MEYREYKVYKTEVILAVEDTDGDGCVILRNETVYGNVFYSRKNAIRIAQRKFAKNHTEESVKSVFAKVTEIAITDNGIKVHGIIYRKYKV